MFLKREHLLAEIARLNQVVLTCDTSTLRVARLLMTAYHKVPDSEKRMLERTVMDDLCRELFEGKDVQNALYGDQRDGSGI